MVRIWVQQGGVGSGCGFCDGIEVGSGGVRTGRGQRVCLPSGIVAGPGGRHGFAFLVERAEGWGWRDTCTRLWEEQGQGSGWVVSAREKVSSRGGSGATE